MTSILRRELIPVFIMAALFAATAYADLVLARQSSRIALLWLPNAMVAAWLLRSDERLAGLTIVACALGNVAVNRLIGDNWGMALALAFANAVEILAVVWLMRRACGTHPDMAKLSSHGWLVASAVSAALISATIAAVALSLDGDPFPIASWLRWVLADGLSLLIVLPIGLIAIDSFRTRHIPSRDTLIRWGSMAGMVTAGSVLVFAQSRFPFLFLISPLVLYAAFRTGLAGTAVAVLIVTVVASVATSLGLGPITLVRGGTSALLVAFQVFLASNFAIGLPVAAMLAERAKVREALKESRDETRKILDNVREIIFRADEQGRWISLNPAWEDMTGYTVEESLGWSTTRLLLPEDFEKAREFYPGIVSGEIEDATLTQRFTARSGEIRTIEVGIRRQAHPDGQFAGTIGNIRDVTDQLAQERALATSEARFRMIGESAPVGIFLANAAGELTYINRWWAEKVGRSVEEMLGHGWIASLADAETFMQDPPFRNFTPGMVRSRHIQFRASDGTDIWMETHNAAEFDDQGAVIGFAGAAVDVTAQRKMTEELAQRDRELTELADNVTDALVRLGPDGTCLYASPSAEQVFGMPIDKVVGTNLSDVIEPGDLPPVLDVIDRLARGKQSRALVAFRTPAAFGAVEGRWFEASCAAIAEPDGSAAGYILASVRDITHTKRLEGELRSARSQAEAAARAKSIFLANMSHEIRTPMNGVIGFTDLLEQSDLDDDQLHYVQMIAESGQIMMELLNDILDESKMEAGTIRIASEPIDLREKICSVVRLMQREAERKGIALELSIAPNIPTAILGDRLRLRQIMQNLIGNAVKFTERGKVGVGVTVTGDAQGLEIEVADTGVGIGPENLETIFEPFAQADDTVARRYGGSGLGLAITRQLVELMGGSIKVVSQLNVGSTFTVTLPLVPTELRVPVRAAETGKGDATRLQAAMRVLVAEDNEINQHLIRTMIEKAGGSPQVVGDGAAAIAAIEEACSAGEPFDLVLMDLQMPDLDGLEATRILRKRDFTADRVPIVALTANAYDDDVRTCLAAGMQGHVAKPLTMRSLTRVINRFAVRGKSAAFRQASSEATPYPSGHLLYRQFAERKSSLRDLVHSVTAGNVSERTPDIVKALHQLAGTAGVFGEVELGEFARQLEHRLLEADSDSEKLELISGSYNRLVDAV